MDESGTAGSASGDVGAPHPQGATPDTPVAAAERLVALDFIRGIAVVGILFANITAFGHPFLAYYWPGALPGGGSLSDDLIWLFQLVFVDGKFRGLFTILFGAGMMLFMERAWQRGDTRWIQARRLVLLLLVGIAHFFLLFIGDILTIYAISGLLVLVALGWSAQRQFWFGLVWYLLASAFIALTLGMNAAIEAFPGLAANAGDAAASLDAAWATRIAEAEAERAALMGGSYGDVVAYRWNVQAADLAEMISIAFFETMPLMLIGMALYRFGFFAGGFEPAFLRRWGWAGVATGALTTLALGLWVLAEDFSPWLTSFVFNGASALTRFPMILGMAALLSAWAPAAARSAPGQRFVAAGRAAFTNYIGTSVLMTLVFHGWAGGLYGELGRAQLLLPVLLGWAVMLAWSKPWLERFRYGPLEWLWRCLTYGRIFAMRR